MIFPGASLVKFGEPITSEIIDLAAGSFFHSFELCPQLFYSDHDHRLQRRLRDALRSNGKIAPSWHLPYRIDDDLSQENAEARQWALSRFRAQIPTMRYFECRTVVVHSSNEKFGRARSRERIDCLRQSAEQLSDDLASSGIRLALENLPRQCLGNTPDEILHIIEPLDKSLFGICLDVNHLMANHRDAAASILRSGKRLFATHISDYDGIDERHWLPGCGVLDFPSIVRAFSLIGFSGAFNYEVRLPDNTPKAELFQLLEANFRQWC